jgi:hypothetical protein
VKKINQRNIKIVDELMSFCYKNSCVNIKINVLTDLDITTIILSADIPKINPKDIEYIKDSLNTPRYHEMEEYYWSLTGDDDDNTELSLVGMMVDAAEIKYNDPVLEIVLKRTP